jgi:hypothetical protein
MRRSTAISQVLLLLAFYAAPLLAGSSTALPACCRRDGAHHCAMQPQTAGNQTASSQTAFSSPVHCPYRFTAIVLTHVTKLFLNQGSTTAFLSSSREVVYRDIAGHVPALFAVALDNRGPPALTL